MVKKASKTLGLMLVLLTLIPFSLVSWHMGQKLYWQSYPEKAFVSIAKRDLPSGVKAIAYTSEVTDNLFHQSHYWILTGSAESLREVVKGTELGLSNEDAYHALPDVHQLFGLPLKQFTEGYEEGGDGRNDWYWVFDDEIHALYEYN